MTPLLKLVDIEKSYNNETILSNINLDFYGGKIYGIVGLNGSGKSTLAKILSGYTEKDKGSIYINGEEVKLHNPSDAIKQGIFAVHQDQNLFENLTVAENIFSFQLSNCAFYFSSMSKSELFSKSQQFIDQFNLSISAHDLISDLSFTTKKIIELIRAFHSNAKIIILDESCVSMNNQEISMIFRMIQMLKKRGITVIYISQHYDEILKNCDEIRIVKDKHIYAKDTRDDFKKNSIINLISPIKYLNRYPKLPVPIGKEVLAVKNLSTKNMLKNINFSLYKGEILGIAGYLGSGRSTLAKSLFGLKTIQTGKIYIDRLESNINSPKDAIDVGIAYIPEDRLSEGLYPNLDTQNNIFSLKYCQNYPNWISTKTETPLVEKLIHKINLNSVSPKKLVKNLSGGEQQKIMLSKWLGSQYKIFILDEPTTSIDLVSKVDIYNIMANFVHNGASIILISSDFEELAGLCDRILILSDGQIKKELNRSENNFNDLYKHFDY